MRNIYFEFAAETMNGHITVILHLFKGDRGFPAPISLTFLACYNNNLNNINIIAILTALRSK